VERILGALRCRGHLIDGLLPPLLRLVLNHESMHVSWSPIRGVRPARAEWTACSSARKPRTTQLEFRVMSTW